MCISFNLLNPCRARERDLKLQLEKQLMEAHFENSKMSTPEDIGYKLAHVPEPAETEIEASQPCTPPSNEADQGESFNFTLIFEVIMKVEKNCGWSPGQDFRKTELPLQNRFANFRSRWTSDCIRSIWLGLKCWSVGVKTPFSSFPKDGNCFTSRLLMYKFHPRLNQASHAQFSF